MNTLYLSLLAIQDGLQVKGWIVTLSGFLIVITALVILFFIFTGVSKVINANWKKASKDESKKVEKVTKGTAIDANDNIIAAIGLALSLSMEVHDNEPDEITITRIQRRYSPWSSKIYSLRETPNRK